MRQSIIVTGMVIGAMPISEYDKRIVILTKERGKITAFARGARRPNSSLLAATNQFAFGEFELFEGKSSYNVLKANIHNYFREITMDVEATYLGFYFLEIAEYYCQENNDEKEMLKLLYQSLRALISEKFDYELVRRIYELKAITINGEGPNVFSCMRCGEKEQLIYFSVPKGGLFCEQCGKDLHGKKITESTRYTIQYIVSSTIEKLFNFRLSEEVFLEFSGVVQEYLNHYLRHSFKSLEILENSNLNAFKLK